MISGPRKTLSESSARCSSQARCDIIIRDAAASTQSACSISHGAQAVPAVPLDRSDEGKRCSTPMDCP